MKLQKLLTSTIVTALAAQFAVMPMAWAKGSEPAIPAEIQKVWGAQIGQGYRFSIKNTRWSAGQKQSSVTPITSLSGVSVAAGDQVEVLVSNDREFTPGAQIGVSIYRQGQSTVYDFSGYRDGVWQTGQNVVLPPARTQDQFNANYGKLVAAQDQLVQDMARKDIKVGMNGKRGWLDFVVPSAHAIGYHQNCALVFIATVLVLRFAPKAVSGLFDAIGVPATRGATQLAGLVTLLAPTAVCWYLSE